MYNGNMNTISDRLKTLMDQQELTQYRLWKLSDVPQPTIKRILDGQTRSPDKDTVTKLAGALGVSYNYLYDGGTDSVQNYETMPATVGNRRLRLKEWFSSREIREDDKSYISQLINGKSSFGENAARRLEQDYGMPEGYLDTNINSEVREEPKSFSSEPYKIPDGASIRVYDSEDELDKECYVFIDVYDVKLSAGTGTAVFIVNQEDPISFRRAWFKQKGLSPQDCKGLYVRGRSMEPALNDRDTVLIDTSDTEIVDGDIYALGYKGNFFIKTLYRTRAGVLLKSENPQYESIEVPDTELNLLKILGKKVWRAG